MLQVLCLLLDTALGQISVDVLDHSTLFHVPEVLSIDDELVQEVELLSLWMVTDVAPLLLRLDPETDLLSLLSCDNVVVVHLQIV